MYAPEPCGRLWDNHGDWRPCYLVDNHDGTCPEANHQAALDNPDAPTPDTHNREPWL